MKNVVWPWVPVFASQSTCNPRPSSAPIRCGSFRDRRFVPRRLLATARLTHASPLQSPSFVFCPDSNEPPSLVPQRSPRNEAAGGVKIRWWVRDDAPGAELMQGLIPSLRLSLTVTTSRPSAHHYAFSSGPPFILHCFRVAVASGDLKTSRRDRMTSPHLASPLPSGDM